MHREHYAAVPAHLVPPELRAAVAAWLAEQEGAAIPPARPAWSRPGWHDVAEAWVGCDLAPESPPWSRTIAGGSPTSRAAGSSAR